MLDKQVENVKGHLDVMMGVRMFETARSMVLASYPIGVYLMKSLRAKKPCTNIHEFFRVL